MKITAIRATPINLPLEAPYEWVFGELPGFSQTIVEIETDDGIIGLGEAPTPGAARLIDEVLAPRLIGRDPLDINGAEEVALPFWTGVQSINDRARIIAFGAIEMALWDIRGKLWQQPLYMLLGGAVRRDIPFTDYFAFRPGHETTPEAVADYCVRLNAEHGTTYFEGKISTPDPAPSLRLLTLIRDRLGPDIMLRIDSNQAYSLATARRMARPLEELGVRNWEDPVATPEEMARLRQSCSIPFSTHNIDLGRALSLGVPDAIVSNPTIHGGINRLIRFIGACEQSGIDFWCYSGDSGIASAAYLHLSAALPWLREPSQSLFRMQPIDVTQEGPFRPQDNVVPVPEGPGLGVTLAPDKLAYCHRLYVEQGPINKYHDPLRPGTYRRLPLA